MKARGNMSEFFDKKTKEQQFLSVYLGEELVTVIEKSEIPCEKTPVVFSKNVGNSLRFVDSEGGEYSFSLDYESGYIHLSVRVHENLACQADCLISETKEIAFDAFQKLEVKGIRFQPFFLPGGQVSNSKFKGRGFMRRGFHYPGRVTPGNVSLSCICDECKKSFRVQSFHAGFSDCGYFYSESGKETLTVSGYVKGSPPSLGKANLEEVRELETKLPKAKDGTSFSYFNGFRCPHCGANYIDFKAYPKERELEYYGNVYYGESTTVYEE
jgi:hypothetical protein